MSRAAKYKAPSRRGKNRLGPKRGQAWGPGNGEEAWGGPPSARRGRWDGPPNWGPGGPADWGPGGPPDWGPGGPPDWGPGGPPDWGPGGPPDWGPGGPPDWGPMGPPPEMEGGPGPPFPSGPWDWRPLRGNWRGRPWNRPPGEPRHRPDAPMPWGGPPDEGPEGFEQPRRQRPPRRGGGRWSSPERMEEGRRRSASPEQWARDGPRDLPRKQSPNGERRTWGSPGREGSPGGAGGKREKESQSPSRERRSLGSSVRDIRPSREQVAGTSGGTGSRWGRTERRGREHHSPIRKQSAWGSPKREERQERSGSSRRRARELDEAGGRRSSPRGSERSRQNRSREGGSTDRLRGEWQNPNGEATGRGSPRSYEGIDDLDGEGEESYNRGREMSPDGAGSACAEERSSFIDSSCSVPKEWTPCESVVHWWMQCQSTMPRKMAQQLKSTCPRPVLPDRSSETPQVNPRILSLLNNHQQISLRREMYFVLLLQEEVLDMLAPAMTVYEMAEEAMERGEPVDPMELREWSRHLIRFIGSINSRLLFKQRSLVLGFINPRLKVVAAKMSGQSPDGMLFAEDKVKLLKEIIMRFPQLTEIKRKFPRRRYNPFAAASYKPAYWKPFLGSRSKAVGIGKRGTGRRMEQSHSKGAGGH
ncbi:uncharacterized protein LOC143834918 isoform X2 [Paroedura picta]|uniref:uncharacterized protein LOC143834918 isoform X2 n=1 Tax=Paroedura picta TaxID=143630 RepID=UPI004056D8DC